MSTQVRIGFLRLTDSAPIVVARSHGLFQSFDLHPHLSIEPSWADITDKLSHGLLDAAVMVPPLALALAMGLRGPKVKLIVPMGLSQGGNTIVLGGNPVPEADELPPGARLLAWLKYQPRRPRIAVVHRFSTHNLLLRYWLWLTGLDPDRDIETVIVPPEQVVQSLASHQIAGFCAGAPWGAAAELEGAGKVLLGSSDIWPFHPEKCLAVRADWAASNPDALTRLLRALMRAQMICDRPGEAEDVASTLADPGGLALPREATRAALPGGSGDEQIHFHGAGASFPARPHAAWFLRQMSRWGWLDPGTNQAVVAATVYRPDLFAAAAQLEDLFVSNGSRAGISIPQNPAAELATAAGTVGF